MLTLDLLRLDLLLSLHCMAQLDPITFVMGKGCYGSCLSARSFTTPGFATFAMSLARIDLSPLTLDLVHLELSLFLQSSAWSGFSLFALDLLHMDLSMLPSFYGICWLILSSFQSQPAGVFYVCARFPQNGVRIISTKLCSFGLGRLSS